MRPPVTPPPGNVRPLLPFSMGLALIVVYLFAELLPFQLDIIDNAGTQWLYLAVVNVVVTGVLLVRRQYPPAISGYRLLQVWLLFLALCTLSGAWAFNTSVWLVSLSRLCTTTLIILNTLTVMRQDGLRRYTLPLLVGSGVLQSLAALYQFAAGTPVNSIHLGLGNRNVVVAALVIKCTVAMYYAASRSGRARVLAYTAVTMIMLVIYLLSSRAGIAGLFFGFALCTAISFLTATPGRRFRAVTPLLALYLAATILMQVWSAFSPAAYKGVSIAGRMASIAQDAQPDTFSRLTIWRNTARYIGQHPFTGGGMGNWPINSIPFEVDDVTDNYHTKHAHNDFLEIAADAGIITALIYLSIFVCSALAIVSLLRKGAGAHTMVAIAPFAGLLAYMNDALFNFPLERPGMQVLFAITFALACCGYPLRQNLPAAVQPRLWPGIISGAVALGILFVAWQAFRTMQGEYLVHDDVLSDAPVQHTYAEIEPFFSGLPDVTTGYVPVSCVKARYLVDEKRYQEAFAGLAAHRNANPNLPYTHQAFGKLFFLRGDLDSALFYFTMAYRVNPTVYRHAADVQQVNAARRDTNAMRTIFWNAHKAHRGVPAYWTDMASWTMRLTGNVDSAISFLEQGARAVPYDPGVHLQLHYLKAYRANVRGQYAAAIEEGLVALKMKETLPVVVGIGQSYLGLGKYADALPYFDRATRRFGPGNGESLYYSGQCHWALGQFPAACRDFAAAIKAGYKVEPAWLEYCR